MRALNDAKNRAQQGCAMQFSGITLTRYDNRELKIRDATGSKFSQRRHVTHAQAVVLMASRRVENVKFEVLALRRKREYFPFQFAK